MKEIFNVCGVSVNTFSKKELAEQMIIDVEKSIVSVQKPKLVFSLNGESLSKFHSDSSFKKLLKMADIIHPDGQSIVAMGNLLNGGVYSERVATTDFFHDAAEVASDNGFSFFFLGSTQEECELMIKNMQLKYPSLIIAGYRNGYFDETEEPIIISEILNSKANVLWVGLGRPKQEEFSIRNRDALVGVAWIKTCGGLFNFLSGKNSRAPVVMQKFGLEWLYRLMLEPNRLFFRYIKTNIHSLFLFFKYYWFRKL